MGISLTLCIPRVIPCIRRASTPTAKQEKVLRIVKMDGKIIEFKSPVLVKDILTNLSGLGIGLSRQNLEHLPPNYQLKLGEVYYILPSTAAPNHAATLPAGGGVRRIKVIITKQQLEQLVTKQTSVGEVLSVLERKAARSIDLPTNWKPKLESIPEGTE